MAFSTQNSLFKIDICRALEKEKKYEEIYRHKSMHVSRSSKSIDQSFMTSLNIYLQQSKRRFLDVAHTWKKCIHNKLSS